MINLPPKAGVAVGNTHTVCLKALMTQCSFNVKIPLFSHECEGVWHSISNKNNTRWHSAHLLKIACISRTIFLAGFQYDFIVARLEFITARY